MSVKERLISYLKYKNISNRAFSLSIGMSENYVSSMRKSLQPEVIHNIAIQYPDFNTGWLLTGEGEMLKSDLVNLDDFIKLGIERENKGMSQQQLADNLGVSLRIIQKWEYGNSNISIKYLYQLVKLLGLDKKQIDKKILETKPESQNTYNNLDSEESVVSESITGYYLPDVSASAGLNMKLENSELQKIPISIPGWEKEMIFINVYGDSMYPRYNAGEIIAIKGVEFQYINYGFPYVVVFKNGDVYIKYIKKGKDKDSILLVSENKFYEPKEFSLDLIKNIYSIKGVIKKELM